MTTIADTLRHPFRTTVRLPGLGGIAGRLGRALAHGTMRRAAAARAEADALSRLSDTELAARGTRRDSLARDAVLRRFPNI